MMLVNRGEAEYIKTHSDYIRISTTCKKKKASRKKYFCEEGSITDNLLLEYRNSLNKLPVSNGKEI